jgi:hypothetical protein
MKSKGFRFWIACVFTECGNALPDKNGISNGLSVDPCEQSFVVAGSD